MDDIFDDPVDDGAPVRRKPPARSNKEAPKKVKVKATKGVTRVERSDSTKAKQKKLWTPENRGKVVVDLRQKFLEVAQAKFGVSRVFGSRAEMKKLVVGIRVPSLAFEYLIGQRFLPLRSMLMLAGTWSTMKSSLLYEMMRWFLVQNGLATIIDTENKFSVNLASSVMQDPSYDGTDDSPTSYSYFRAYSLEEAQAMITATADNAVKLMIGTKEDPGPGLCVPVIIGYDSLAAANSQSNIDAVAASGHANRQHPINALLNKHFVQAFRPSMSKYPILFVVVNHCKQKSDDKGFVTNYTLGGQDTNFLEAIEIHSSVWSSKLAAASFTGKGVRLSTAKNSFASDKRTIRTRFLWWDEIDEDTGTKKTRHVWDWNWAIMDLLATAEGSMKAALKANGIIVKARSPSAPVDCKVNIPALGMGKEEYIGYQEAGQMLHDNEEVSNRVRQALGIEEGVELEKPLDEVEELHIGKKGFKKGKK